MELLQSIINCSGHQPLSYNRDDIRKEENPIREKPHKWNPNKGNPNKGKTK